MGKGRREHASPQSRGGKRDVGPTRCAREVHGGFVYDAWHAGPIDNDVNGRQRHQVNIGDVGGHVTRVSIVMRGRTGPRLGHPQDGDRGELRREECSPATRCN